LPELSDRFDKLLVDLRRIEESVVTGPERLDDAYDTFEVDDPADGDRRFDGIGGTGGRGDEASAAAATAPTDELRLLL
jgi:hypothetical protein